MRRVVEPTAPATTVPTISTDRRRLRAPNVSRNGTNSDVWSLASFFTTSHDRALVTAPSGRAAVTASRASPTLRRGRRRRRAGTASGSRWTSQARAARPPGVIQASAVSLTDRARPTTVTSRASVPSPMVRVSPTATRKSPPAASTTSPGLLRPASLDQGHLVDAGSRTGPGGDGQDGAVSAHGRLARPRWRRRQHHDLRHCERAGGLGDAVGLGAGGQLRGRGLRGSVSTVRCAPCWAAKAWSNGRVRRHQQADPPGRAAVTASGGGQRRSRRSAPGGGSPRSGRPGSARSSQRRPARCRRRSGRRRARSCGSRTPRRASRSWVTSTHGLPVGVQVGEQPPDVRAGRGVQRAGRLVGQQQRRPVHQRPGHRHPLPLAAGQPARVGAGVPVDAQRSEQLGGPARAASPRAAPASWAGSSDVVERRSGRRAG